MPGSTTGDAKTAGTRYSGLLAGRARDFLRWVEVIATNPAPTPDDVHDARVAGRRLAAAIRFFEPLLRRRRARRLRRAVRAAIGALGAFRDADILIELLSHAAPSDEPRDVINQTDRPDLPRPLRPPQPTGPLAAALINLRAGRDAAAARAREDFRNALPHALLRQLRRMADGGLPRRYARTPWPDLLPLFAAFQLQRVADDFAALAAGVSPTSPPETLHRLRIAGKRLRYSVEIALPPGAARPLLETLRGLQDMLGALHDLDVAIDYVDALARGGAAAASVFDPPRQPGAAPVDARLGEASARLRADRADLHRRFLRAWPPRRFMALARRITAAAAVPPP